MNLIKIFKALSDPARLWIIQSLIQDAPGAERHCTSFGLQLTKATRSHHFKILREAGLISQVDRGNCSLATLRRKEIEKDFPGLLELISTKWKPSEKL
ncbi:MULTISPECIES: ArsR/SmtB family transcription factor [Gilliamella]|uniref:DNA-binding transcriptional regulator, ArsR family n=1 Tax=Gilliamella bombicola TaxID=1798182 RepID=A0A1C3ZVR2_9GAMM|nr:MULTISPECIES: ArsR family transcriptional regulator [Gilliamella]NUF27074.1 helix-turn-helix transcriptional regulator [Gilliamella sp. ESL0254]SCB86391.1 DNA-binding transcriptional regulator, ArsR family [Gilliamella bombicola]